MTRIAHVSDLHFGAAVPDVVAALLDDLGETEPDLVVISGDLTQRARRRQFAEARRFIAELPAPHLVVPGNHDIPLFDVVRRFARPLARYRRYIHPHLTPSWTDGRAVVCGINTAMSLTFSGGRATDPHLSEMERAFAEAEPAAMRILVSHHPVLPPAGREDTRRLRNHEGAVRRIAAAGVRVILSGHLHTSHADEAAEVQRVHGHRLVTVQAGTATSSRLRGEPNAWNLLTISGPDALEVETRAHDDDAGRFARVRARTFDLAPSKG